MTILPNTHTSPETAYVVADYPYGFRMRCSIRYWLEHKSNHGFRLMSQTTNPKRTYDAHRKPGDPLSVGLAEAKRAFVTKTYIQPTAEG